MDRLKGDRGFFDLVREDGDLGGGGLIAIGGYRDRVDGTPLHRQSPRSSWSRSARARLTFPVVDAYLSEARGDKDPYCAGAGGCGHRRGGFGNDRDKVDLQGDGIAVVVHVERVGIVLVTFSIVDFDRMVPSPGDIIELRVLYPESDPRSTWQVVSMQMLPLPGWTKTCTMFVVAVAVATRERSANTKTILMSGCMGFIP